MNDKDSGWTPLRPTAGQRKSIADEVADISVLQQTLLEKHKHLCCADRVAHQYQIAGGRVELSITDALPEELNGVGLFIPGSTHTGIARVSTGLGTPHIETNPDFLGLMAAFQTDTGARVDFLAINTPTSPTDDHRDFMNVLHATAAAAGADMPLIGGWGEYDAGNLAAEQKAFGMALIRRMGLLKAGKNLAHIVKQTLSTFKSSTAYQAYWTGINEVRGRAGKFTFIASTNENKFPGLRPGEWHLSEEWKQRQAVNDIVFSLYWIPYLDATCTPTKKLTQPWQEDHKQHVGTMVFPKIDPGSEQAQLWAILASEMGANPGNWVHDRANSIHEPATEFGLARKLAYQISQQGRNALMPGQIASVFRDGKINAELAQELKRRCKEKQDAGHMSWAPRT
jgi:hypothetical protein